MSTEAQIHSFRETYGALRDEIGKVIVGHEAIVEGTLIALLAGGHVLLEGVPGLGKTLLVRTLSEVLDISFNRVQFTPDLMPADILGTNIVMESVGGRREFQFQKGPIFAHLILADEINRATPKTQSALLEAMNEQQISVEGKTLSLPDPFMVIATQNPAEHHGTYPLPESQLDRFLMRLRIGYPDLASEREIIRQPETRHGETTPRVLTREALLELQEVVKQVRVDEAIVDYMLAIVERTRTHDGLALGVSPRGSQAFYRAVQAYAVLEDRAFAVPDDAKILAPKVFGHRVVPVARQTLASRRNGISAATGERVIEEILSGIEVPL